MNTAQNLAALHSETEKMEPTSKTLELTAALMA